MDNFFFRENCFVYEIYPQSETPHLTQIAHLDLKPFMDLRPLLLPDTVIWFGYSRVKHNSVFRIWDYQLNHSIYFSIDVDYDQFITAKVYNFILFKR